MPRIDGRTGDVVVRIVYDGIPEAGKTTNIQQLFAAIPLQRRGSLASPATTGRRTEFFDWLDFAGGFVNGRRVRCQLVSVPGQPALLHRRRYLLEAADAVVFVADSRPASADESRACVATLLRLLARFSPELPAGVVVQANKQDLDGALRPRALGAALELSDSTPVVPAVARAGRGVMDTFVLAARLATDRVRSLMLGGTSLGAVPDDDGSPDALHAAMVKLERAAASARSSTRSPPRDSLVASRFVRERPQDVEAARRAGLPRPEALLAGHVWPSMTGRAAVSAAVAAGSPSFPDLALAWAPVAPLEIALEGWVLHSSAGWLFASEPDARAELTRTVRAAVAAPALVPDGRVFFVAGDGRGYRMWMLTPSLEPLAAELGAAIARRDVEGIASATRAADRAAATLEATRGSAHVPGGSAGIAMQGGEPTVLGVGAGGERVDGHARRLALEATEGDAEGRACVLEAHALQERKVG